MRERPRDPARWVAHAKACLGAGLFDEAERALTRACRLAERPELWQQLARLRFERRDLPSAIAAGERMIALRPDDAALRLVHGRLLLADDRMEEAQTHLRRALAAPATRAAAALSLGRIALFLDRREEACAWFRRAFENGRGEPLALAQLLRHDDLSSRCPEAHEAVRLAAREDLPPNVRAHLLFGHAECLIRDRAWDACWKFLERANAMMEEHFRRLGRSYDPEREEHAVARLVNLFDEPTCALDETEARDEKGRAASSLRRPVFIVGMPRSGTSILERTLVEGTPVVALGERPELGRIYDETMARHRREGRFPLHDVKVLRSLRRRYFDMLGDRIAGAAAWTDKMPANIYAVGIAAAILPEARFLFLDRRGWRDHYFSLFRHPFSDGYFYTTRIEHIDHFASLHRRMARCWRRMTAGRCMDVVFEDFIADPQGTKARILRFLELPDDTAPGTARRTRSVRTFSHGKAHRRADPSRVFDASPFHAMIERRLDACGRGERRRPYGPASVGAGGGEVMSPEPGERNA